MLKKHEKVVDDKNYNGHIYMQRKVEIRGLRTGVMLLARLIPILGPSIVVRYLVDV